MRHAHQNVFFHLSDGKPIGLSLGFDWCAEHEHGISGLRSILGVKTPDFPMGVEDRLANPTEENKANIRFDTFSCRMPTAPGSEKKTMTLKGARLYVSRDLTSSWLTHSESFKESLKSPSKPFMAYRFGRKKDHDSLCTEGIVEFDEKQTYSDPLIEAQWDQSSFKVVVWGTARVKALASIYEALLAGKCTLSVGSSPNPFSRGGLHLMLVDEIPQKFKDSVLASDQAHKALMDDVKATRIEDTLKAAGKGYYALQPRYFKQDGEKEELKFFLNPREQHKYESGWFTVQELEMWAKNTGPVLKEKESV